MLGHKEFSSGEGSKLNVPVTPSIERRSVCLKGDLYAEETDKCSVVIDCGGVNCTSSVSEVPLV
jgi:hypothetical protein